LVAKSRVLLIEDDVELLQMMSKVFADAGFEVMSAQNGRQGLELFDRSPADLVITDMIMPVVEGVETILALRRRDTAPKIIAISGGFRRGEPDDCLALARQVGADQTLGKPFRLTALLFMAQALLAAEPGRPGPHKPRSN
jgi:DNA-binding response OmpR family regulator